MIEEWRPVVGWEGLYEVSNMARVKTLARICDTCGTGRNYTTRVLPERINNLSKDSAGYYRADLRRNGRRKNSLVHRLVAEAFIPNPENKPHINHIDGNKTNNSIGNLEWCTHQENMRHAFDTGLTPRQKLNKGELSISSKLNNQQVLDIRKRLLNGESAKSIAKSYYPTIKTVSTVLHIKHRRTWSHI